MQPKRRRNARVNVPGSGNPLSAPARAIDSPPLSSLRVFISRWSRMNRAGDDPTSVNIACSSRSEMWWVRATRGGSRSGSVALTMTNDDPRPLGSFALLTVPIQIIEMVLLVKFARAAGMSTTHIVLQELVLGAFALAGLAIWAGTHGRTNGKVVGTAIMLAFVGTLYFMFFAGGLIDPPA